MELNIRRILVQCEDTFEEGAVRVETPLRKAGVIFVVENPLPAPSVRTSPRYRCEQEPRPEGRQEARRGDGWVRGSGLWQGVRWSALLESRSTPTRC